MINNKKINLEIWCTVIRQVWVLKSYAGSSDAYITGSHITLALTILKHLKRSILSTYDTIGYDTIVCI